MKHVYENLRGAGVNADASIERLQRLTLERSNDKIWQESDDKQSARQCSSLNGITIPIPTESPVRHRNDGLPENVARLKALGNAVVPQIPEIIGRAIMEAEHEHNSK